MKFLTGDQKKMQANKGLYFFLLIKEFFLCIIYQNKKCVKKQSQLKKIYEKCQM